MQHTTKYKFNLIETSDAFSPEALNANAQQLEDALITHEAAVDGALKSQKLEWQAADDANKAELQAADAAVKSELQNSITSTNSSLSGLQSTVSSIQTALGSGGSNCRITYGTYKGNGKYGSSNATSLSFSFRPCLVAVGSVMGSTLATAVNAWPTVMIQGCSFAHAESSSGDKLTVTWSSSKVSWYHNSNATYQHNTDGVTYYYVAIGI